ncbi:hypothetical protein RHMOL_Rhmol07G0316800 [Rhododendron molle]|uniref:Uncharacterized protein n=2 Tax=Rhododendron molle TaxID=49168 RepID=A0ACC0N6V8_RHOML|nr:hypothetical protein RHMOL_Rhmol07G0316800 [Rhododendron molle]KAI8548997.1 hypothetical protein RHMOL_Rhmol07G0316800 [Rhododendron molle]
MASESRKTAAGDQQNNRGKQAFEGDCVGGSNGAAEGRVWGGFSRIQLGISVTEILEQQKVMFTIQKEMQASLDRLVSPGPRSAPTLLSSTPADTVDTSTTPADTTTPVADTPSSTTTPSSAAPDVEDTPEPTYIFD